MKRRFCEPLNEPNLTDFFPHFTANKQISRFLISLLCQLEFVSHAFDKLSLT